MDARNSNLLKFVKDAKQFVIPIYQRKYSWDSKQCDQLWKDILRAGRAEGEGGHFIGSIVYIADGDAHNAPLLVIDGQQRLTTLSILIAALSEAVENDEPHDGFSGIKLRNYYLVDALEKGEKSRKLVLSETDKETLFALIDKRALPANHSIRVEQNFKFFEERLRESKQDLPVICRGLAKLMVVYVALSRKEDNPQLIFESMNSTGRELSQADLIRNFILMGLETDLQSSLYTQYWRPMEVAFGQEAYDAYFDGFMRHYLTVKTGDIPRLDEVYEAFKAYARKPDIAAAGVTALVEDIARFSGYFCSMALDAEKDKDLKSAFSDLRELKVDVAYPLLLEVYDDYRKGLIDAQELIEIVRLVEAYTFRRAICNIPTNSMNKTFATFTKTIRKDAYLESVRAHFRLMPSYRRFPTDDEFFRDIQKRDLYNFRSRSYWLRRFENYGRKEPVYVDNYTIEHIMPQSENLPKGWKDALGENWKAVHSEFLHTLGNLTLTGYNSEYSNNTFEMKRDMKGGFKQSPLNVNDGLGQLDSWNADEIRKRAARLAKQAVEVWKKPQITDAELEKYKTVVSASAGYTIEDHPHLLAGLPRELFEALRAEVTNLDPCITVEFLKLYVAFKAETNFVDVVPLSTQLRLTLNMPFPELNDPKGIAKDVSGKGQWGNGDVQLKLSSHEELPYVIGLVRQSLERQLGGSNAA